MTDFATQRKNMVHSQVMPQDVTDRRIVRAMLALPREPFLPASLRSVAYTDRHLPLGAAERGTPARHLLAPGLLARLIQLAAPGPRDIVLDVACASGYSTALLARLSESVVGVEADAALAKTASETLNRLGVENAAVVGGDLTEAGRKSGPYDVILVNGAVGAAPEALLQQLKPGGRLVAVLGADGMGRATVWQRVGDMFAARAAFDAGAPLLAAFARKPEFSL